MTELTYSTLITFSYINLDQSSSNSKFEKIKYPEPEWIMNNTKLLISIIENSIVDRSNHITFTPIFTPHNGWWIDYNTNSQELIDEKLDLITS